MTEPRPIDLDERTQHILRVLIGRYIRDGQPVGSRTLSNESGLELSAATIRNIMADLEDLGFLKSPHTSAGRVPTIQGYRFFVDTLLTLSPPQGAELRRLERDIVAVAGEPQAVALSASNLLSALTRLAGVVTVPRPTHRALRQIEFLPLSGQRVLAILVLNDTDVQNKILEMDRDYTTDELRQASNYLTEQFAGRDLREVRRELLRELTETRETMNALMIDAIDMARKAFPDEEVQADFVLAGETNLMDFEELADIEKLRSLFEAFSRRRDILRLLDQSLNADGVQIFIGRESGHAVLDSVSIVSAPYATDDDNLGVIGVIGPTRMAYERIIPIVDITAKLLGRALNSRN
jgi:heat-inducible transcriptional repressor